VKHADRVVVVHGGGIAEMGTHEELMTHGAGIYRRLATLQSLAALPTL
jgi:ABC-type multidrug transport system fused ATPase/permease subunit